MLLLHLTGMHSRDDAQVWSPTILVLPKSDLSFFSRQIVNDQGVFAWRYSLLPSFFQVLSSLFVQGVSICFSLANGGNSCCCEHCHFRLSPLACFEEGDFRRAVLLFNKRWWLGSSVGLLTKPFLTRLKKCFPAAAKNACISSSKVGLLHFRR